jgi:hypothetical protein
MNLTMDDLRGDNCRSCGTVLPHRARAAQQVAVVQQMLGPMAANAQLWGQAPPPPAGGFGVPGPHYDPYAQQRINAAMRAPMHAYRTVVIVVVIAFVVLPMIAGILYYITLALVFRGPG